MRVKFLFLVLYCCVLLPTKISAETGWNHVDSEEFDRNHLGVVFSPYIKNWVNGSIPNWNDYTMKEIKYMLEVVSTKFKRVSTYGMGVASPNASWDQGDGIALTAFMSAENNAENAKTDSESAESSHGHNNLSIDLGIWHSDTPALYQQEINNALSAAVYANAISPNTVWGLSLSSLEWMSYRTWKDATEFLIQNRSLFTESGLKIGVRVDICHQAVVKKRPEVANKLFSAPINEGPQRPPSDLQLLARYADYIICVMSPSANQISAGTQSAVNSLGNHLLQAEKYLKAENADLKVIWETGWPSAGVSSSGSKNTVRNLRKFWKEMGDFAKSKNIEVYMLEAFDQPWKVNLRSNMDITDPEGPNGANSHYGLWTLEDNANIKSIREKIPDDELPGHTLKCMENWTNLYPKFIEMLNDCHQEITGQEAERTNTI